MSDNPEVDPKVKQRNRYLGLALFGLVVLIFVVSYAKIKMVTP